MVTCLAAAVWLGAADIAYAGGRHKVPDLRGTPNAASQQTRGTMLVPLTIHVASDRETRAQTMHRVRVAVSRANRALEPYGFRVVVHKVWIMPTGYSTITRRRDHRRLAEYAGVDGTVHVFMVDELELGSRLSGDRGVRGMHWRYRGLRKRFAKRQYVVVNSDAPSTTLVHELGHLFGLEHAYGHNNLMCSCRRGPRQIFTRSQGMIMRREARAFFRDNLRAGTR